MSGLTGGARRVLGRWLRHAGLLPPVPTPTSTPGLFLRRQVIEPADNPHQGPGERVYGDLRTLSLNVAHAFECSPGERRRYYAPIADLIQPGERILDIGCGDGTFLELVRDRGAKGVGVDLDPAKVAACVDKGLEAYCIRVQEIGQIISGNFDFVSLIHIIEHLSPSDALQILDSLMPSLARDGRIFIVTPNISHPQVQTNFWLDVTHVRPYPEQLLGGIVSALGFPCFQSGEMTFGTEAWCYGFGKPEQAWGR